MSRRRRLGSRSERYARRTRSVIGWSVGLLAGIALLLAVGYVHGNPPSTDHDFVNALHTALARPAVAALAAFAGLLTIAWCTRHLMLEMLAWLPGKVVVEPFETSPEIEDADLARLTAAFRSRLAKSHLQSLASVPAAAPQGDFLDVLSARGMDAGNLFGSMLGLLGAAVPDHAYEVRGVLLRREQDPRFGVTVQVERLPGQASAARTFWDTTWDEAVDRAADHATASILPRTRHCRAPWAGWRGYHLPSALVHNYERAAELEEGRRFDEALDRYYAALRDDPMNLGLRLQIGFLQEKLALFLDAFATYEGILSVASPGHAHEDGGPARRARVPRRSRRNRRDRDALGRTYRAVARRDREGVLLVAQYRRAILLAGHEFPRQWRRGPAGTATRRDRERAHLRERLRPRLEAELAAALDRPGERPAALQADEVPPLLAEPARAPSGSGRDEAPTLLDLYCLVAARAALRDLRRQAPVWSVRPTATLSRSTVELSTLWTDQRIGQVSGRLGYGNGAAGVEELIRRIAGVERGTGFRRWQDHYNAACLYALPLLGDRARARDELAHRAVERLERAIECADSGFVASHRDWVLADDPDLEGLRAHPDFKHFEAMFFPSPARPRTRPPGLHRWELSQYTVALLGSTARRWERLWEARRAELDEGVDARVLFGWCELEIEALSRVREVARHHRHWRTRVKLIEQVDGAAAGCRFEPLAVSFPRFADAAEPGDEPRGLDALVDRTDRRLRALVSPLKRRDGALLDSLTRESVTLGLVEASGWRASRDDVRRLCDAHACVWRSVRLHVQGGGATIDSVRTSMETARRAWEDGVKRWQAGEQAGRGRRRGTVGAGRRVRGRVSS